MNKSSVDRKAFGNCIDCKNFMHGHGVVALYRCRAVNFSKEASKIGPTYAPLIGGPPEKCGEDRVLFEDKQYA